MLLNLFLVTLLVEEEYICWMQDIDKEQQMTAKPPITQPTMYDYMAY